MFEKIRDEIRPHLLCGKCNRTFSALPAWACPYCNHVHKYNDYAFRGGDTLYVGPCEWSSCRRNPTAVRCLHCQAVNVLNGQRHYIDPRVAIVPGMRWIE